MSKQVYIAKEIVLPEDLAERIDKRTGAREGYTMELATDAGALANLDHFLLGIASIGQFNVLMKTKDVPEKPYTIERFSGILYALGAAYMLGSIHIDEDGDLLLGTGDTMLEVLKSDEIRLRSGQVVSVQDAMNRIQVMTSPKAIKDVWEKVKPNAVQRVKGDGLKARDMFLAAITVFEAVDKAFEV